jgi:hypothetical protein
MEKNIQFTIETGAMTLVLLVKNYKSQMVALLLKNGVTVPRGTSDQQIASLMANLLKVSKSFFTDLNNFLQNPKVLQVIAGGMTETAQYLRASGYMNSNGGEDGYTDTGEPAPTTSTGTSGSKGGFWAGINFGDLFNKGLDAFGKYDKNATDKAIADARARAGLPPVSTDTTGDNTGGNTGSGSGNGKTPDTKISTTTIVVLSLVGVAVLGTIIYFVARPKQ